MHTVMLISKYLFQLDFINTNATIFKDLKCKTSTSKMHIMINPLKNLIFRTKLRPTYRDLIACRLLHLREV